MATYSELHSLIQNSELINKVTVAVGVVADAIRTELPATTNHANRLLWAKDVWEDPRGIARQIMWAVVIANRASTTTAILAATDAAIQSNVDAVVDIFATGA